MMSRKLPVYNIEGTDFIVDVENLQLQEKDNPKNVIKISEMWDTGDGYEFAYSRKLKTIPLSYSDDSIVKVRIPQLKDLDPVGMVEKYDCSFKELQIKNDFDFMVDQQALGRRLLGQLPTIDIVGNTYYVDIANDKLRPANPVSEEIPLNEMSKYFSIRELGYIIPYNPTTRNIQDIDLNKITEMPKGVVTVFIPPLSALDIVGFNIQNGITATTGLKDANIYLRWKAAEIDWKKTFYNDIIQENKRAQQEKQQHPKEIDENKNNVKRHTRGRKL